MYGCPLNCFWCCNPGTRFGSDYKTLTPEALHEYIKRDRIYFKYSNGGITFSGGEPLLYADFIEEYIRKYGMDISVNIETSLFAEINDIKRLIPFIDNWFIDFKVFDKYKHLEYTNKSNDKIKENIAFLSGSIDSSKIVITYPIISEYNTSKANIDSMINFLCKIGINKVSFHPYRKESEIIKANMGLPIIDVSETDPETYRIIEKTFSQAGFEIVHCNAIVEREKCRYLKQIRKDFAKDNGIVLDMDECLYNGRCSGTCPKCETELNYINDIKDERKNSI